MRIASNKIADIARFFREELQGIYDSGEIETFIMYCFEEFIGMKRAAIRINGNMTVSESELLKFNFAVKNLKQQKPIQYILGNADFYGLKLDVNENVLIPRPETEELVDLVVKETRMRIETGDEGRETEDGRWEKDALRLGTGDERRGTEEGKMKKGEDKISILDIGTGSGCIAIALKKKLSFAAVSAVDISEKALHVAKGNAIKNQTPVEFYNYDVLSGLPFPAASQFDIIVSNPPYIALSEKEQMNKNVIDYEPHMALFVNDSEPLLFYRAIANFALKHLKIGGKIYFEINQKLGAETKKLLENKGFNNVRIVTDLNANQRIVTGTL